RQVQTLYRARVFEHRDALQRALENPERELGPPAAAVASAGRMNSKGISVFYGALERRTALHEVRPPVGAAVAIAAFTLIRPLRLLHLSALTAARLDPSLSLFDPATRSIAQRCDFINSLEAELTKPVLPSFTDGGYLITQAIADYLATHRGLNLDGIFFKSAQYHGMVDEAGGHNVILFHKAAAVKIPDVAKTSASLARQVGEDEWEGPSITTLPKEIDDNPAFHGTWPGTEREESLELQRDSIEIHRVSWVDVKADVEMVEHKFAHSGKPSRQGVQE
ncbi:RES family NAD+ phosphorylase, partial [Paraburkholderia sediminicola]